MNSRQRRQRKRRGLAGQPARETQNLPASALAPDQAGLMSGTEELPLANMARASLRVTDPSPELHTARAVWILLAVLILSAATLSLWFLSRTPASSGLLWETRHLLGSGDGGNDGIASEAEAPIPRLPLQSGEPQALTPFPEGDQNVPPFDGARTPDRPTLMPDRPSVTPDGAVPALPTAGGSDSDSDGTAPFRADTGDDIVYYRCRNDRKEIALSFDDGPHPRYTPEILRILAEYGVEATFFMVGENVRYFPETAAAVLAAGHEIGNHSTTHKRLSSLSPGEVTREIRGCEEALDLLGAEPPRLLRPPEGRLSPAVRRLVSGMGYKIILWDVDTRDWAHTPASEIAAHVLDSVSSGDIILMHDYIGKDSPTPDALRLIIPELLRRGYRFVTVSRLIDGA